MEANPAYQLLKNKATRPSLLYSNVGRISKSAGNMITYLCNQKAYQQLYEVLRKVKVYTKELETSCLSCRLLEQSGMLCSFQPFTKQ